MKLKKTVALILDDMRISRWQLACLREIADEYDIHLFSCTNTRLKRNLSRHFIYYALNAVTVRNAITRKRPITADDLSLASTTEFESEYDGLWQRFADETLHAIDAIKPKFIVKFGMGLLRVPPTLSTPILSFHHGDPEYYRGRPAGFYEMLGDQPIMGQIVQILSNKLDAGQIIAIGHTKVTAHSYRRTLIDAYSASRFVFRRAVAVLDCGTSVEKPTDGRNYRLPSNMLTARFVGRMAAAFVRKLLTFLFFEKKWTVHSLECAAPHADEMLELLADEGGSWRDWPCPTGFGFIADPFFLKDGSTLVEAYHSWTGIGDVFRIMPNGAMHRLTDGRKHHSYPCTFDYHGRDYILPEIAGWSGPVFYELADNRWKQAAKLDLGLPTRITDPTIFEKDGVFFLFGNARDSGSSVLRLWIADELAGPYREHPASPLRLSPVGSRMAGAIHMEPDGTLVRFGQNLSGEYGDGIVAFRINHLDKVEYSEFLIRELKFVRSKGPHTINQSFDSKHLIFDRYTEQFNLFASVPKILSMGISKI